MSPVQGRGSWGSFGFLSFGLVQRILTSGACEPGAWALPATSCVRIPRGIIHQGGEGAEQLPFIRHPHNPTGCEWYPAPFTAYVYVLCVQGHTDAIWSVCFSPDGTQAATAGWDGSVRVWEVSSGRCSAILKVHSKVRRAVLREGCSYHLKEGHLPISCLCWCCCRFWSFFVG